MALVDKPTYFRIRRTERRQTIDEVCAFLENGELRCRISAEEVRRITGELRAHFLPKEVE